MTQDEKFMKHAMTRAKAAAALGEVPIGAVIVKDKRIMTTGYNGAPAGLKTCKERGNHGN